MYVVMRTQRGSVNRSAAALVQAVACLAGLHRRHPRNRSGKSARRRKSESLVGQYWRPKGHASAVAEGADSRQGLRDEDFPGGAALLRQQLQLPDLRELRDPGVPAAVQRTARAGPVRPRWQKVCLLRGRWQEVHRISLRHVHRHISPAPPRVGRGQRCNRSSWRQSLRALSQPPADLWLLDCKGRHVLRLRHGSPYQIPYA